MKNLNLTFSNELLKQHTYPTYLLDVIFLDTHSCVLSVLLRDKMLKNLYIAKLFR